MERDRDTLPPERLPAAVASLRDYLDGDTRGRFWRSHDTIVALEIICTDLEMLATEIDGFSREAIGHIRALEDKVRNMEAVRQATEEERDAYRQVISDKIRMLETRLAGACIV
jgi:hypothetical protein